jgi:hypothetical protein
MSQNVTRAYPPKPAKKMKGWVIALIVKESSWVSCCSSFHHDDLDDEHLEGTQVPSAYVGSDGYVPSFILKERFEHELVRSLFGSKHI